MSGRVFHCRGILYLPGKSFVCVYLHAFNIVSACYAYTIALYFVVREKIKEKVVGVGSLELKEN